jgi:hypothetical protein
VNIPGKLAHEKKENDMTQSRPGPTSRTPRHLWVIGIVALLWNCIGAFDYLMTQTKNAAYMSGFPPEQLAWFYALPAWFAISLAGLVVTTFHNYVLSNGLEIFQDTFSRVFTAVIFAIAVGLFLYARAMRERGVLV